MNRGMLGGNRPGVRSSMVALQPGYTTPNTGTVAGSSASAGAGGRRSGLPRPSGAAGVGGSIRKQGGAGDTAVGTVKLRRRSSIEKQALRSRVSVAGGLGAACGTNPSRLSMMGDLAGPSSVLTRATPVRNPLSVATLMPPLSAQSKRLSCESRQSTSRRRKRQEVRPISDPAFKKSCVDNIMNFLLCHGFEQNIGLLSRKQLINPSTKDFTNIFQFIYSRLDINYKLPARFDEEIPNLLKMLQYPTQIPKSTFVTVGSPHSWPTLLAMLSWLCDMIPTGNLQEMAFPADFSQHSEDQMWEVLSLYSTVCWETDEQRKDEILQEYQQAMFRNLGVDDLTLEQAEASLQEAREQQQTQEQQLQQQQDRVAALNHSNEQLKCDLVKLEEYRKNRRLKLQQLQEQPVHLNRELESEQRLQLQLQDEIASLTTLKESQSFTPAELLSMKNHPKTYSDSIQQLQQQAKDIQARFCELEIQQCRLQHILSEYIKRYNSSSAAALVGSIACTTGIDNASSFATESAATNGAATAGASEKVWRPEESDLRELNTCLIQALRRTRQEVVEAHVRRSQLEEQCRLREEETEEQRLLVSQLTLRIKNIEEDMTYTKQENETEEAAMLQQYSKYQQEAAALRRAPKPELFTKQQHLATLKEELECKRKDLERFEEESSNFLAKLCAKLDEQLEWEAQAGQQLKEQMFGKDKHKGSGVSTDQKALVASNNANYSSSIIDAASLDGAGIQKEEEHRDVAGDDKENCG